jgi:hypothetical protein
MERVSFKELELMDSWEEAVVVFTVGSFEKSFTEVERSYRVNRDKKYFNHLMIGSSLWGDCLDGKDNGVRLDLYLNDEEHPWTVDYCYIVK